MTPNQAISWTVLQLEHFFGIDTQWFVRVIDELPGHPDKGGHCSEERHCITLVEKYLLDDANALRLICHEIAHVLSPQDLNHGFEFKNALKKVREVSNEKAKDRVVAFE